MILEPTPGEGDDGPPETPTIPDQYIAPTNSALYCEAHEVTDDHGVGWVMVRFETCHGSFVAFLHPDVADNFAPQLTRGATLARLIG